MTRNTENSDDTGFNWAVYGSGGMAKETVGARVPVAVAEQVDRYAETHEITRTAAIELFIRTGLDGPDRFGENRVYTGRIREDWHESAPHRYPNGSLKDGDREIGWYVRSKIAGGGEWYPGEWSENEALTARLPGEVVRGIEAWSESLDVAKSKGAAYLLRWGLALDPLPADHRVPLNGETYTVELEPELADKFRRYRLANRHTPSEAVSGLLGASRSRKSVRLDWGNPREE
jgi:hypothetical protein